MARTTIILERSAYELLKSQKLPDESFSEEVRRLLGPRSATLKVFLERFAEKDARDVGAVVKQLREEDLEIERRLAKGRRISRGHRNWGKS